MSIKKLTLMGNPILRQQAKSLSREEILSEEIQTLIEDLRENMNHYGGVGIAAPQIGEPYSIAVLEIKTSNPRYNINETFPFTVFINPKITPVDPTPQGFWEGCLSVPGLRGYVERPRKIRVDFLNEAAEQQSVIAEGFLSTVFQHELDHLIGKLYIDRITDTSKLAFSEEYELFIRPTLEQEFED